MGQLVGVDIGGTFTDFVLIDADRSEIRVHKVSSTPADPTRGLVDGLLEMEPAAIDAVIHGTTVATNAILERKGARCGLIATRGDAGEARVDAEDLLQASLRMRPDRILLGELRGREAFTFLRAVNTGHPGSITTVHADNPDRAIDQIALMSLLSGVDLGWNAIRDYIHQVIDVVVQLRREDGVRRVVDIRYMRQAAAH